MKRLVLKTLAQRVRGSRPGSVQSCGVAAVMGIAVAVASYRGLRSAKG